MRRSIPISLLACLLLGGCDASKKDPARVQQQMESAVALHSTPGQVLAYLDANRIDHSKYHRDTVSGNVIEGVVSVKAAHDLVDPGYNVAFHFDDHDRLRSIHVEFLGYIGL